MEHFLLLLGAGVIGGMINAIAGGGGIIMYPALLASGLAPIIANATAHFVALSGSATSVYGYRQELRQVPRSFWSVLMACLVGTVLGCYILTRIEPATFENIAPWLVLSAVILLALQSRLHRWLHRQTKTHRHSLHTISIVSLAMLPLGAYGGFFGAGFGLMLLVVLGFTVLNGSHQLNAFKNACGLAMGIVATIYLALAGLMDYQAGTVMGVGAGIGGLVGAKLAHKVSAHVVHDLTVIIGFVIAIILIIRS